MELNQSIDSHNKLEYTFIDNLSYQTKNKSHKNIIQETTGWNNQNQINVCRKIIKAHNQIQKFKNISWILFSLNLNINFDNQVQKAKVHTKNQAQKTNKSNSLKIYKNNQDGISDFLIHKFKSQNNNAHKNKKIENFQIENFLFLENRYAIGGIVEIKAQTTTNQLEPDLNIS